MWVNTCRMGPLFCAGGISTAVVLTDPMWDERNDCMGILINSADCKVLEWTCGQWDGGRVEIRRYRVESPEIGDNRCNMDCMESMGIGLNIYYLPIVCNLDQFKLILIDSH